jgi:3-hydroxy-9,10-secoandrosta-1,3,5(10)-triene-9,17-dione monooxygenase reductase component
VEFLDSYGSADLSDPNMRSTVTFCTRRMLWDDGGNMHSDLSNARALRTAFSSYATGVTVITTTHEGIAAGVTANSFNSLSLTPPMVIWSLGRSSSCFAPFMNCGHFAVHVLAHDQLQHEKQFSTKNIDRFASIEARVGEGGVPVLKGCAATFECKAVARLDGGDHVIILGEIVSFDHQNTEPLVFHNGRFRQLQAPSIAAG